VTASYSLPQQRGDGMEGHEENMNWIWLILGILLLRYLSLDHELYISHYSFVIKGLTVPKNIFFLAP
jgi:hypothetical protein